MTDAQRSLCDSPRVSLSSQGCCGNKQIKDCEVLWDPLVKRARQEICIIIIIAYSSAHLDLRHYCSWVISDVLVPVSLLHCSNLWCLVKLMELHLCNTGIFQWAIRHIIALLLLILLCICLAFMLQEHLGASSRLRKCCPYTYIVKIDSALKSLQILMWFAIHQVVNHYRTT